MINILQHRCTVTRCTETFSDGSPTYTWQVVGVRVPVLLSPTTSTPDPTWTSTQRHEADTEATLFALPNADLAPGDRITMTRPPSSRVFEILPDASVVMTLHQVSHHEFKVREVS